MMLSHSHDAAQKAPKLVIQQVFDIRFSVSLVVVPSNFNSVAVIWRKYLWDKRYDFKPTSSMLYLGGYDDQIPHKYQPSFFIALFENQIAGVISGHKTTEDHFRMRGICVLPEFRKKGISQILMKAIINEAKKNGCKLLWSTPRQGALRQYEKIGFIVRSDFTHEGFLFGPNCYVSMDL
jgi:GNAT superfamily N-acetyltransferase